MVTKTTSMTYKISNHALLIMTTAGVWQLARSVHLDTRLEGRGQDTHHPVRCRRQFSMKILLTTRSPPEDHNYFH